MARAGGSWPLIRDRRAHQRDSRRSGRPAGVANRQIHRGTSFPEQPYAEYGCSQHGTEAESTHDAWPRRLSGTAVDSRRRSRRGLVGPITIRSLTGKMATELVIGSSVTELKVISAPRLSKEGTICDGIILCVLRGIYQRQLTATYLPLVAGKAFMSQTITISLEIPKRLPDVVHLLRLSYISPCCASLEYLFPPPSGQRTLDRQTDQIVVSHFLKIGIKLKSPEARFDPRMQPEKFLFSSFFSSFFFFKKKRGFRSKIVAFPFPRQGRKHLWIVLYYRYGSHSGTV